MCGQLTSLRAALFSFASSFDPSLLSPSEAAAAVADAAGIEASAAALKALAAVRAVEGAGWRSGGRRSDAEELAARTGTSRAAAEGTLSVGRRLCAAPEVAAAALAGELSPAQVALVAGAAEASPSCAAQLVELARDAPLGSLRDEVAKVRAAACPDLEARRQALHARRSLRAWTDAEGAWHLHAVGGPEDGAQLMAVLAPRSGAHFAAARREGRREAPAAYAFDALVDLAKEVGAGPSAKRGGAPAKILVRVDYDALLAGTVGEGQTCELVGYGPVALSVVHELYRADAFVAAVLTKAKAVVGVAHLGRRPNAWQESALEWQYPSCAAQHCPHQAYLETDHRADWARTHVTVLGQLDRLCSRHHAQKTRDNWSLVEGTGKRPFVPPEDPRHPGHEDRGGGGGARAAPDG